MAILAMLFWTFGGALVAQGSPVRQAVAAGVLQRAGTTTCGHPLHPGVSLRLYLTSGGGRRYLPTSATVATRAPERTTFQIRFSQGAVAEGMVTQTSRASLYSTLDI